MNKQDLINKVSTETGLSKADAKNAVEAVFGSIKAALTEGDIAQFIGFGTFKVTDRAARTGRNPKTGEEIQIAASKVPTFKAGKAFKQAMN